MVKRLIFSSETCIGCQNCELSCSMKNSGVFSTFYSRIRSIRFSNEILFFLLVCFQCEQPLCVKRCKEGAIFKEEKTGLIKIDNSKCNNCFQCIEACPYGAIFYGKGLDHPIKCELCGGDPECIKFCPTNALSFKETKSGDFLDQQKVAIKIHKKRMLDEKEKNIDTKDFGK